jgi:hypothetical protein
MSDTIGQGWDNQDWAQDGEPKRPPPKRSRGRWWRWPGTALILLVEAIIFIVAIGGAALSWRAAQGPVDLSLLLPKIGRAIAVAAPKLDVSIGHLAIAWRGFTQGPDQPVQLTAAAIRVDDKSAHRSLAVDRLNVDLSAAWAVRGVIAPRTVALLGPRVTLRRGSPLQPSEGQPAAGRRMTPHDIVAVLEQPPETDKHLVKERPAALSELVRVTVTGGQLLLEPASGEPTARTLRVGDIAGVITRGAAGGLTGEISTILSTLAPGEPPQSEPASLAETPTLSGSVTIGATGAVHLQAQAKVDDPAGLVAALAPPEGTPVPAMPLQVTADVAATPDLSVTALKASLTGGTGTVSMNGATIPVLGVVLGLTGDGGHIAIDPGSHLALGAVSRQPPPTIAFGGDARWQPAAKGGGMTASVTLGIDHVASNDVPAYWPPKVAVGARSWISAQVHNGLLHDGSFRFGLSSGADLSSLSVNSASGSVPATGLTVAWLPPLPPLTAVQGAVKLEGPDAVGIAITSASQGDLHVSQGTMRITGLSAAEQIGTIAVNVTGPVASVLNLLNQKRLNLLKSVPVPLNATSGTATTSVALTLPLDAKVTLAQIGMKFHSSIQNLALQNLVLGRGLTGGQITIDADQNKLHLAGGAALATIPVQIVLDNDFTAGPPTQVIASLSATATADQVALARAGIVTGGVLNGPARFSVSLAALRNGRTDINATITLPEANLRVVPISWAGGAGQATASAHLALQGARIVALDGINLQGPDVGLKMRSVFMQGQLSSLIVDQLVLGRTNLHGSFGLPAAAGDPYVLNVAGQALDLSTVWGGGRKPAPSMAPANNALSSMSSKSEFAPHPPWRAQLNLDRILFGTLPGGRSRELDHLNGLIVNNGVVVQSAQVGFVVEPSGSQAHLSIVPEIGGTRDVTLTSGDFGGLLKATNAYDLVTGGALRIDATYDDRLPNHPLSGTAEMDAFSLGDAPTVAKALAAMTLYGVVDLMQGPGLFFRKLVAPFHLADRRLDLTQSRAFSASLGITAHGSIDLPDNRFNLQGTIVPAYFFNSLLGHIPLIGKYFSPEKGGGLFAAKYELVGPIDNPQVHVNPLSLITPGFLRDFTANPR